MSTDQLPKDLKKKRKMSEWECNWKMLFKPDLSKQAQEVIFSRTTNKINTLTTTFNTVLLLVYYITKNLV